MRNCTTVPVGSHDTCTETARTSAEAGCISGQFDLIGAGARNC